MDTDFRKRDRQHLLQDDDSDMEMESNSDAKEFGGKRGAFKGQIKQNHSEIEKRRRDKMNTYINELSSMIPMCNAMSRKLDKLTVLRMAVQHMRALRGSAAPVSETNYKPSFLSDEDLKNLVLESADGFLVVVGCDRGRILYVSDSVQRVLSQPQSDLVGQSFFDLVHPKDIATVKDQLSFVEMPPQVGEKSSEKEAVKNEEKQVSNEMCSGARRSFMTRMKCGFKAKRVKVSEDDNGDFCIMNKKARINKNNTASERKKFVMVHFTGYLKSWPPTSIALDDEEDPESKNLSCLIAVGREVAVADLNTNFSLEKFPTEFVSRHSIDGKFIYLDQRVTAISGYLPQEMIGMSAYDFFHPTDIGRIAESHKSVLETDNSITEPYRFLCKEGHYVYLVSKSTIFRNPWTKEREFIICINSVDKSRANPIVQSNISHPRPILPAQDPQGAVTLTGGDGISQARRSNSEFTGDAEEEQAIDSSDTARIGSFIAEAAQGQSTPLKGKQHAILGETRSTSISDKLSVVSSNPGTSMANVMDKDQTNSDMNSQGGGINTVLSGISSPVIPNLSQPHLLEQLIGMQQAIESMESPLEQNEETMAMFMNMLEADAGLGGNLNNILFQ